MASQTISIDDLGEVSFHKRRGMQSIKLRIDMHGKVIVTLPHFVAYHTALGFVEKHKPWVVEELSRRAFLLYDGMVIGRVHVLRFIHAPGVVIPKVRVTASQVVVTSSMTIEHPEVQNAARKGCVRALKREAAHFLPKRLADIARAEGYDYGEVSIKQLRGRWGSCDQHKNITFNCYLMQLPIEYIDYVIYHELAHTRVMHHGPEFWREFEDHLPGARVMRKSMKQFQPTIPATRVA